MESKGSVGLVTESELAEGCVSTRRVMELLPDVTHPVSILRIAKRLGWKSRKVGGTNLWDLDQVLAERERRMAGSGAVAGAEA